MSAQRYTSCTDSISSTVTSLRTTSFAWMDDGSSAISTPAYEGAELDRFPRPRYRHPEALAGASAEKRFHIFGLEQIVARLKNPSA